MVIGELLGVEQVVSFHDRAGTNVTAVLKAEVRDMAVMLMDYVKTSKLSGQVLHNQSGRLRRSVTAKVEGDYGLITGIVGTNVEYAAAHEFGVDKHKIVTVHAYLRKCKNRNTYTMKAGKYFSPQGAAKLLKLSSQGVAFVHEFQRNQHTKLPERSFLRSALEELGPDIHADLRETVLKALNP